MSVSYQFECDIQTVYEALTEPQFLVDRCQALGQTANGARDELDYLKEQLG